MKGALTIEMQTASAPFAARQRLEMTSLSDHAGMDSRRRDVGEDRTCSGLRAASGHRAERQVTADWLRPPMPVDRVISRRHGCLHTTLAIGNRLRRRSNSGAIEGSTHSVDSTGSIRLATQWRAGFLLLKSLMLHVSPRGTPHERYIGISQTCISEQYRVFRACLTKS
jgi:hypothetical protein